MRELAHGGTSTVYEAVHRNGRRVAVKVLRPALAADQRGRKRFLRESALANRVNHPGVISVIDEEVTPDGLVFLVMELLTGETLEQRWARHGKRIPVADAISIAVQILEPLVAVHRVGIVHRDLKPSNVFLSADRLRLLDFGVARLREVSGDEGAITRSGAMLGTPAFMAPEQARGHWHDVDARTDIWAVGAILFTLLTGRYVHEGRTPNELLIASATQPAESLARLAPDAPARLVALVDRALLRDRESRWPDAASMLGELRSIQESVPEAMRSAVFADAPEASASITTLPEDGSLPVSVNPEARRSRLRPAPALLLAAIGVGTLVVGVVVKPRFATTALPTPSSAPLPVPPIAPPAVARTLQAATDHDDPPVAERDHDATKPLHTAAAADLPRVERIRGLRATRTEASRSSVEDGRARGFGERPLEPPPAPSARQTFSGIVVDDDALDQRR